MHRLRPGRRVDLTCRQEVTLDLPNSDVGSICAAARPAVEVSEWPPDARHADQASILDFLMIFLPTFRSSCSCFGRLIPT
jgi:hypothetical protein